MGKCKPGDTVWIKEMRFTVLGNKGAWSFVLLRNPTGYVKYGKDCDYNESGLRQEADAFVHSHFEREEEGAFVAYRDIRDGACITQVLAAPLTFNEYQKYAPYVPKCGKANWLATKLNERQALCLDGNNEVVTLDRGYSLGVRLAMWVSEKLIGRVETEDDGLRKYSTMELIQELAERVEENDVE